jgi:hypothetical protein
MGAGGRIRMSFAGDGIWDMGDREVEAKDYGLEAAGGEPSFAPNLDYSGGAFSFAKASENALEGLGMKGLSPDRVEVEGLRWKVSLNFWLATRAGRSKGRGKIRNLCLFIAEALSDDFFHQ